MSLSKEQKQEIFAKYGSTPTDTGSVESQVALFSTRISDLTQHLKKNRKDFSTQKALKDLVGKRQSLLNYRKRHDVLAYRALIEKLGLRK